MADSNGRDYTVHVKLDDTEFHAQLQDMKQQIEDFAHEMQDKLNLVVNIATGKGNVGIAGIFPALGIPSNVTPAAPSANEILSTQYMSVLRQIANSTNHPGTDLRNAYANQPGMGRLAPGYAEAREQIIPWLRREQTRYNTNMGDDTRTIMNKLNSLNARTERLNIRVQGGYSPSAGEVSYLQDRTRELQKQLLIRQQHESSGTWHPEVVAAETHYAIKNIKKWSAEDPVGNKTAIEGSIRLLERLFSQIKGQMSMGLVLQDSDRGLNSLSTMPTRSAWNKAGAMGSSLFRTMFPAFAFMLGAEAFGQSFNFGSNLAVNAGALGMQTGSNPNMVYNKLLSVGASRGFSASQVNESTMLQGQFAGTGNVALLFKDAMQTAQFARYLGLTPQAGAQLMAGYQLNGAFTAGNESATAHRVANLALASGMNTQAFSNGLQELVNASYRTGIYGTTGGPAQSLALTSGLGNALGMNLFQGPNAAQSLLSMSQGFSMGPGQGSGLTAQTMLPIYRSVLATQQGFFKKYGITNPALQGMSLFQTPLYAMSGNKALPAELTGIHNVLTHTTGVFHQAMLEQFSQFMFGNMSENSLKNTSLLGGANFQKSLSHVEAAIRNTKNNNPTNYLQSIANSSQSIKTAVEAIQGIIGGWTVPIGGGLAAGALTAPHLVSGGITALQAYFGYRTLKMAGMSAKNIWKAIRGKFTKSAGTSAVEDAAAAAPSGLVDAAGNSIPSTLADTAGIDTAIGAASAGLDLSGIGLPLGIALAGGYLLLSHMKKPVTPKGMYYSHGRYVPDVTTPFAYHSRVSNAMHGMLHTVQQIANVGNSQGFKHFINSFSETAFKSSGISNDPFSPVSSTGGHQNLGYVTPSAVQSSFVSKLLPTAHSVVSQLGIPKQHQAAVERFLLTQWAGETGWGQHMAGSFNYGNIKIPGTRTDYNYFGTQPFANADAQLFLNNPRYAAVLKAMRSGASVQTIARLMQAAHYAGNSKTYANYLDSVAASVHLGSGARPSTHHNQNKKRNGSKNHSAIHAKIHSGSPAIKFITIGGLG